MENLSILASFYTPAIQQQKVTEKKFLKKYSEADHLTVGPFSII